MPVRAFEWGLKGLNGTNALKAGILDALLGKLVLPQMIAHSVQRSLEQARFLSGRASELAAHR